MGRVKEKGLFAGKAVWNFGIGISATNVAALRQQPHKYVAATVREGDKVYTNETLHLKGSAGSWVDEIKLGFGLFGFFCASYCSIKTTI